MKLVLILCLMAVTADIHAVTSNPPKPLQPFTAVFWTTTTLHSPTGKSSTFMRRTVCTRDAILRCQIYQPTKGLQHDVTAPLERVVTGPTSAQDLPHVRSNKETVEETDLGTQQFSGFPAQGRRQTFRDPGSQRSRTIETWFSPVLGLTVHMEGSNAHGDTISRDLSELHLGKPDTSASDTVPAPTPAIPLLSLYKSLFTLVAHMERDRLAPDPNRQVDMNQIEDHLRTKIGLSSGDWQVLVEKSVKIASYTHEAFKQAHDFADQNSTALQQNPPSASTVESRATLRQMRLGLNTHIQGEVDKLNATIGQDAANRISTYLHGPLTAATTQAHLSPAQVQALRARTGGTR